MTTHFIANLAWKGITLCSPDPQGSATIDPNEVTCEECISILKAIAASTLSKNAPPKKFAPYDDDGN